MTSPEISIILPFYNATQTLEDAINSIRSQTFGDWELILFDDGSEDNSLSIAEAIAKKDKRIRLFSHPHAGLVTTLNAAIAQSKGRFLARMDADDLAYPARLEQQYACMNGDERIGICGTGIQYFGRQIRQGLLRYQEWINSLTTHEEIVRDLFIECPIPHPTFMMRRKTWEDCGGYHDCAWPEDYDLCMRVVLHGWKLAKVPETLLRWRDSERRLSRTDSKYSPESFRKLKGYYLKEMGFLSNERVFVQWGAGQVGKLWLKEWTEPRPAAVVDINPRKTGRTIHGFPVISPEELMAFRDVFIVVAVGAPGAREEIRAWLRLHAFQEIRDFLFLA